MIQGVKFYSAGHFTSNGKWRHPSTTRQTWELIYMIEGCAHLYSGENTFTAKAGDVFLFAPGFEHGGTEYSEEIVSFIWMHFTCTDAKTKELISSLAHLIPSVSATPIPSIARTLLHKSRLSFYNREVLDVTTALLILEYQAWAGERLREDGRELIQRVREWVRINSDKLLTVNGVAEEFGYNPDYLSTLFRRKTGGALKSLIVDMRMNALRTQLSTTDLPLKRIAMDFEFQDYKAFLKFFTYHEGITPTEYRESCYMTYKNNK